MPAAKRALITGLNGFTGHYVATELSSAGFEIFGLGQNASDIKNYSQLDLTNVAGLRQLINEIQPHVVLHLAAIAFVGSTNPSAFYQVNTAGTRNLLEALASEARNLDCVLLASSANVYGNANAGVLDESARMDPANDYAVSKLAMEYMARLWFAKLPIVIVRPFNYTGVGQTTDFLLPKIVDHFKRGARSIELGNLDVFRDFSDVRAVATAYRRLVDARPAGQTINVCSGTTYSLRDVILMVESIAGYKIEVKVNPVFIRPNEVRSLMGSSERLKKVIGDWKTPPLLETLQWMLHAGSV